MRLLDKERERADPKVAVIQDKRSRKVAVKVFQILMFSERYGDSRTVGKSC